MKLFKLIFCLWIALISLSCKTRQKNTATENTTQVFEKIIEKDSAEIVPADSTFYKAYIDCVNGKPILIVPKIENNTRLKNHKKIKSLQAPRVTLKANGELNVDCYKEAEIRFHKWRTHYISQQSLNKKEVQLPPVIIEKPLHFLQKLLMGLGVFFILVLIYKLWKAFYR